MTELMIGFKNLKDKYNCFSIKLKVLDVFEGPKFLK